MCIRTSECNVLVWSKWMNQNSMSFLWKLCWCFCYDGWWLMVDADAFCVYYYFLFLRCFMRFSVDNRKYYDCVLQCHQTVFWCCSSHLLFDCSLSNCWIFEFASFFYASWNTCLKNFHTSPCSVLSLLEVRITPRKFNSPSLGDVNSCFF